MRGFRGLWEVVWGCLCLWLTPGRGRLKIHAAVCSGSGKTFALLREGQRLKRAGVSVFVAGVDTHGRPETSALLDSFDCFPHRTLRADGSGAGDMDWDAIRALRPSVVLVDGLIHANAPGSRHRYRLGDVCALLRAGISVHTTLNCRHMPAFTGRFRRITGIATLDVVPDYFLRLADEIEWVDVAAEALGERVADGRIPADRAGKDVLRDPEQIRLLQQMVHDHMQKSSQVKFRRFREGFSRTGGLATGGPTLAMAGSFLSW